jgi:alanine dehydrogenase
MKVLIVNHKEVREFLPMTECIQVIENALRALNQESTLNPLRTGLRLPDKRGLLGMMPGYLGGPDIFGLKTVSVFPGNSITEHHSHQGTVMIFETKHGCPLAIMDAGEITAIRTAAASGVATKLLANADADVLAILGAGVQARTHLTAMLSVRDIKKVRIWSKTIKSAQQFASSESLKHDVEIEAVSSARSAVKDAGIICTTTSSEKPVLLGEWLSSGTHINAVGSSIRTTRELDTPAVVKSRLFVDYKDSTVNESGDYLFPKNEGVIDETHILGEIGNISLNKIKGRLSIDEITLFISLGLAIEDLAAAFHIYEKLEKSGKGNWMELGGKKDF